MAAVLSVAHEITVQGEDDALRMLLCHTDQASIGKRHRYIRVLSEQPGNGRDFIFEQQKRVTRGNTTAVLDFWVERMLAVEVDGKEFHHPVKDALRDYDMRSEHGFFTVRVPAWRVVKEVEGVVCQIALRLSQLGHPGFAVAPIPEVEVEA